MEYSLYPVVQVWDFSKLQDQLSSEHSLPCDWVKSTLTVRPCAIHSTYYLDIIIYTHNLSYLMQRRMKAIMATCFNSVRHKLSHKIGYFDLLGFDFMIDTHLNVSRPRSVLLSLVRPSLSSTGVADRGKCQPSTAHQLCPPACSGATSGL